MKTFGRCQVSITNRSTCRHASQAMGKSLASVANKDPIPEDAVGVVVAWGIFGGDTTAVRNELVDVAKIYANDNAFAALTHSGKVVTWGEAQGIPLLLRCMNSGEKGARDLIWQVVETLKSSKKG